MNYENYEYDVAFSYASEQRKDVRKVVDCLKDKNINCFYDKDNTVELWGKHLFSTFNQIFFKKSKYCVIFLSKEYKEKMWCNHEFTSVLNRTLSENTKNKSYLLPILCDHTTFDDIMPDVAYIKMIDYSPEQLADMIYSKINNNKFETPSLIDIFLNIKKYILKTYSSVSNIKLIDNDTDFSLSVFSPQEIIYLFKAKYYSNQKNQIIKLYESKININNSSDIASAEIYLKKEKLYLFNYAFLNDINVEETELTVSEIKSKIVDHLSYYGKV